MTASELIGLLGGIVGLVGGLTGTLNALYQRKQTRLNLLLHDQLRSRDPSYAEWTAKWEQAADALKIIFPGYVITTPGTSANASGLVLGDSLLQRIEHHLGKRAFYARKFQPKALSKDEFLNPVVQEVITDVITAVEKFKKEHTDWSRSLKLLP